MIGLKAVLLDLVPVLFLGVFAVVIWLIIRSREKWWKHGLAWLFIAVALFLGYTFVTSTVAGLRGFYFLRTLQPDDVESISVDDIIVSENAAKSHFISPFHHIQWFASSHGGWAEEVPLRVHLKDGTERTFSIARYLRQPGIVIQGTFRTPWSHRMYDCGFSAELPGVLTSLKIDLPSSM